MSRKLFAIFLVVFLSIIIETQGNNLTQIVRNKNKALSHSSNKKVAFMGDALDGLIGFVLDMLEMGQGLAEMVMSMGRKKRSIDYKKNPKFTHYQH